MEPIVWPGGEHEFRLPIGKLRALDDKLSGGVMAAFERISLGTPKVDDMLEVLRQGLEGGGMARDEARRRVAVTEEHHGIGPLIPVAQIVLASAFYRKEALKTPKEVPGEPEPAETPPAASPSQKSTDKVP